VDGISRIRALQIVRNDLSLARLGEISTLAVLRGTSNHHVFLGAHMRGVCKTERHHVALGLPRDAQRRYSDANKRPAFSGRDMSVNLELKGTILDTEKVSNGIELKCFPDALLS
jgi:hypothetical protein